MRQFNTCVIAPPGYIHYQAFQELNEIIFYSLNELGYPTTTTQNNLIAGSTNIIIGCHLLNPERIRTTPKDTIILNTEQLANDSNHWVEKTQQWCQKFETWDYSIKNIEKLKSLGVQNIKHLKIGHHPKLERIIKHQHQPIDVLFYGSFGNRRQYVLNELTAAGLNVKAVFGIYGLPRDELISKSKVVLNCHHYNSKIFEIVRSFYLMINRKAIAAEVDKDTSIESAYIGGVYPSSYENLVNACKELVSDEALRIATESKAYETISAIPQTQCLKEILHS